MLVPLSWLRDFAPFGDDVASLADTFDDLGMVVEEVRRIGEGLEGVVLARVLDVRAHPKADRVRLSDVDLGDGNPVQIACGAANLATGQLVAVATVGTVLPGADAPIDRRKLRGEWSNGMICSARELGLGDEHEGILVLPEVGEPGAPFAAAMGIQADVVFDLAIEPNRPDAMSIAGVARDAAARLRLPFSLPDPKPLASGGDLRTPVLRAPELCPRISATVLRTPPAGSGGTPAGTPEWMARRLTLAGMRPISPLVDVSNYVMLELGQPTHPYDLDKLPGRSLLVRAAEPGETVTTLDDVERRLGEGPNPDCLICDAEGAPVGIGGIMGGASSEIDDGTTAVLLEAAFFDRMAVARTSKRIGLRSEASARFERGVDWAGVERAVARYAELAAEAAGAEVVAHTLVEVPDHLPATAPVRLRTARLNAVLGTDITDEQIRSYLGPIGFEAVPVGDGLHDVTIPTFRPDAEQEIDVVEEVARHHGYANIPRTVPLSPRVGGLTSYQRERRHVRDVLCGLGLSEAVTGMLIAPGDHERAGLAEDGIRAESPLAREESVLRTSLLPGLLKVLALNAGHRNADVGFFEIGHVYRRPPAAQPLPDERELLAVALGGQQADAAAAVEVWHTLGDALRRTGPGFEGLGLRALGLEGPGGEVAGGHQPGLHPTRRAHIVTADGNVLGVVGEVDPQVVAAHDLGGRVGWLEVDLERLLAQPRRPDEASPVSRFPSSDLDLAFVVPEGVPAGDVEATLREAGGALLDRIALFDVYRGDRVGEGVRGLAWRLRFRALDHTLADDELARVRQAAIEAVETGHPGVTLRT